MDANAFVPSSQAYGRSVAPVVTCSTCGHGSVLSVPSDDALAGAYDEAVDEVSGEESAGQLRTAHRDLELLERYIAPGRLLDVGCWTGSFLVAARARGWDVAGVEPSKWASQRAAARGLAVTHGTLDDLGQPLDAFDVIVMCDVLEHVADPGSMLERVSQLLTSDGALFLTVPDAGSRVARLLGRRWWSVLPMHLQYFTRSSMTRLIVTVGFEVVDIRTHPKVFSVAYYADRLSAFLPPLKPVGRRIGHARVGSRLVAPDLRDRMAVVARRC